MIQVTAGGAMCSRRNVRSYCSKNRRDKVIHSNVSYMSSNIICFCWHAHCTYEYSNMTYFQLMLNVLCHYCTSKIIKIMLKICFYNNSYRSRTRASIMGLCCLNSHLFQTVASKSSVIYRWHVLRNKMKKCPWLNKVQHFCD